MRSLFSTKPSEAGFRLQYMEILNWGTFDKEIYRIHPQGNNSLLTGANGSGKTTLIDALLTLLVPMKKDRFYNQSSGVEKKGDRNEASYMLGYYGNIQEEGKRSSTTQKLREKKDYSILLANFVNKEQRNITIFQVRWYRNNELMRVFGIGHTPMTIQKDFYPFDAKGMWKKILDKKYNTNQLKKRVEFCTGPTQYAERIVRLFGMKSVKALSLFNQVVGIKLLGDLDEFIRFNMLEKRQVNEEYKQLKASFVTLMSAKNDIDKTKEQINQLQPIVEIAKNLKISRENLENLENERDSAVYWFAQKGKSVSEKQQRILKAKLTLCKDEVGKLEENKTTLEKEERHISIAIEQDEIGRQIEGLKRGIEILKKEKAQKKNKSDEYNDSVNTIRLTSNPTPEIFEQNRKIAEAKEKECEKKNEALIEKQRLAKNKAVELKDDIDNCVETLKTLQKNKNNISGRPAAIREKILAITKATREEIPFIGELIKINDSEKEWEAAIEKVLHNFALQLIVPEQYYRQVNEYVNNTNLRGLIVYQRFRGDTSLREMRYNNNYDKNQLFRKISFRPDNPYTDWIGEKIKNQFDFVCSNDLAEFHLEKKAITKEGLIKFGKGKHRKDDRQDKRGKGNYVLGWDNEEKIQWWSEKLKDLQKEQTENAKELTKIETALTSNKNLQTEYNIFVKLFTNYEEINWRELAIQIAAKKAQKLKLEESNDKLKELQEQLKKTKDKIQKNELKLKKANKKENNLERDIEDIGGEIEHYKSITEQISAPNDPISSLEGYTYLTSIKYENFKALRKRFQQENQASIKKEENEISKLEKNATTKISAFKNPSEKITKQYQSWRSDVSNLPNGVEFIYEYQKMYDNLVEEGLVRFENKFNNYLEDTLTDKVGGFNMFFQNWSDDIKKNIRSLNDALKGIEFNEQPKTYIQLVIQPRINEDIKEFRKLLTEAIPNFKEIESSIDGKRLHFEHKIEPFIKKLEDEKWRDKVMEVRYWYEYKAEEYKKSNDTKHKTYTGMGHLSGGEKAQLTYTILGAAIAYQFGLTKEGFQSNSFRFIAIDEAFKAQDEDKARYLIKLCKQLHLQLLVVTPSDNIHIVENDISFVHFVERRDNRNSILYDCPIEEFKEKREKFIEKT